MSGPYALTISQTCQATIGTETFNNVEIDPGGGIGPDANATTTTLDHVFDGTVNNGKLAQTVATGTFKGATLSYSGSQVKGTALVVQGLSGPDDNMAQSTVSETFSYSIPDSSTLVINGMTFQAAFGNIVGGVAHYVTFVTQDPNKPECIDSGTAVHE